MITLEEEFSGRNSDVSHFRIFGAFFYYHVSKYVRKTIEPIEKLGIFVSYTETTHDYFVYFPSLRMKFV